MKNKTLTEEGKETPKWVQREENMVKKTKKLNWQYEHLAFH